MFILFGELVIVSAIDLEFTVVTATEEVIAVHGEGERRDGFIGHFDLLDILHGVAVDEENTPITRSQSDDRLERMRGDVVSECG